jgi:hypothetical protein
MSMGGYSTLAAAPFEREGHVPVVSMYCRKQLVNNQPMVIRIEN